MPAVTKKKTVKQTTERPETELTDRQIAKSIGLGVGYYRVLKAMYEAGKDVELPMAKIKELSGSIHNIGTYVRNGDKSLLVQKLIKEKVVTDKVTGNKTTTYSVSATGRKLIEKIKTS